MAEQEQKNLAPEIPASHARSKAIFFVLPILFLLIVFGLWLMNNNQSENNPSSLVVSSTTSLNSVLFEQLLAGANPSFGQPTAKVKIVEFADFSCPACYKFFPALRRLMNEYSNDIFVIFYNYLLSDDSQKFAEAGMCANEQGKFWPLHDLMYQNQATLSLDNIKKYALQIGLDTVKFNDCLKSGKYLEAVRSDTNLGVTIGVEYTPTIYVNGYKLVGAGSEEGLRAVIEKILTNKN